MDTEKEQALKFLMDEAHNLSIHWMSQCQEEDTNPKVAIAACAISIGVLAAVIGETEEQTEEALEFAEQIMRHKVGSAKKLMEEVLKPKTRKTQ